MKTNYIFSRYQTNAARIYTVIWNWVVRSISLYPYLRCIYGPLSHNFPLKLNQRKTLRTDCFYIPNLFWLFWGTQLAKSSYPVKKKVTSIKKSQRGQNNNQVSQNLNCNFLFFFVSSWRDWFDGSSQSKQSNQFVYIDITTVFSDI